MDPPPLQLFTPAVPQLPEVGVQGVLRQLDVQQGVPGWGLGCVWGGAGFRLQPLRVGFKGLR